MLSITPYKRRIYISLLTKTVTTKWNSKTKAHYIDKGYTYTKMGDELEVKVEDLRTYSRELVDVQCDYCGLIKTIQYQAYSNCMKSGNKYACRECQNKKNTELTKQNKNVENVFMLPEVKEKIVKTNLKKYGVKYHTQLKSYKLKYLVGDKNHFYIDGRHQFTKDRNTWRYKEWRRMVFERDDHKCIVCESEEKIKAHHKNSYIKYKNDRFRVGNGATLCEKCHMEFHGEYGYRDNTHDQFKEWLTKTSNDYPVVGVE